MYDFEKMDPRLVVFGHIFLAANRLQVVMDQQMPEISAKQWFIIMALGMFEAPPTLGELAAVCDSSHQNVRQLVSKLQEKGFVCIRQDEKDARVLRIGATPECERWDRENKRNAAIFVDEMFAGLTNKEVVELRRLLVAVYEQLGRMRNGK